MERIKAFLVALLLFGLTAAGCHLYSAKQVEVDNPEYSVWPSEEKSKSLAGLGANINEDCIPVFGSSEFQHGTDTAYHPAQVFQNTRFNPMLIGAGYYQSLSHSVTLAAIEGSMEQRKAVLILSPQWFRKTGVVDQAYASRFSEELYAAMLQNEKLSDETKEYISGRTHKLLREVDEKTLEHVKLHETVLWKQEGNPVKKMQESLWNGFLREKDLFTMATSKHKIRRSVSGSTQDQDQEPDWAALLEQAEADGEKENQNEFFIDDGSYKKLAPQLSAKKGKDSDAVNGYQNSPEYDDLRCFLQVCTELDITPMLVILPVNGFYYDFTGFPQEARRNYYQNIRDVAAEYGAEVADFGGEEHTKYFFEDRVHIGKKGWVMVNESIYRFYQED